MILNRIKEVFKIWGKTQKEAAKDLGISQGYLSDIFHGRSKPGGDFLVSLYRIYNVNIDWILTGSGEMFNTTIKSDESVRGIKELTDENFRLNKKIERLEGKIELLKEQLREAQKRNLS